MFPFFLLLLLLLFPTTTTTTTTPQNYHHHSRRILHQPFFPTVNSLPPTSQPPLQSPKSQPQSQTQPKYPFSSQSSPSSTPTSQQTNFFPTYPSPPPPPSTTSATSTTTTIPTFPANISSLALPQTSSVSKPISKKLLAVTISLSLSAALLAGAVAFILYRRRGVVDKKKASRSDSLRLFPPNTATSDGGHKPPAPPPPPPRNASTTSSSEFLYLGTLVNSTGISEEFNNRATSSNNVGRASPVGYQKLGSPELHPLPPLPRQNFRQTYRSSEMGSQGDPIDDEDDEFFSPRASSVGKESSEISGKGCRREFEAVEPENLGNRSSNSRTASYPSSKSVSPSPSMTSSPSILFNLSPRSLRSKSPDSIIYFPAPARPIPPPPPRERKPRSPSPPSSPPERTSGDTQNSPARFSDASGLYSHYVPVKLPPPPPPLPPARYWETPSTHVQNPITGPPVLSTPSNPVPLQNPSQDSESAERNVEIPKPKLKPLHWDKVRASSDRAMVWDQLKSSSFQLNEEMIETLFMVNSSNLTPKDNTLRPVLAAMNQENRVLDPKKSQNIAILLRALNVTFDEVCEALLEGNTDTLGTELLESLLKMAPTKEEERKLKEFKDESPVKLGPAEKFLRAVLDVPFAFKRIDAMLYIANFDSEVEYLKRSFETLEAACEELRNNRMFMKLLEAVLKTGNRMNVGTNRGDAHAFKLDTLLKLVDVKGTDGKTTLLHFVVQEIIRSEGSRLSGGADHDSMAKNQQSTFRDDVEFRKLGLQVVSSLSGELTNVKKSAAMDSNILTSEVTKLASGISKIEEVLKLNEESLLKENSGKFSSSMNAFLKNAKEEITKIQAQERAALSMVKEITEYFHGNSAKEAHPCRIFMVVRDFLCVLDQVCKEVGKINERTIVNSSRQFPLTVNAANLLPVFPVFNGVRDYSSSDDDTSSSST